MSYQIIVDTKHPLAMDSNDHLYPLGTRNDNYSKLEFILDIEKAFASRPLHFMDLGCAGGRLVRDVVNRGHIGVGLEGSDFNAKAGRAEWPALYLKNIFSCDVSRDYTVLLKESDGEPNLFECDVISAWEVIEHIFTDRLPSFFENIRKHLKIGGHFYGGVCQAGSQIGPLVYHNSVFPKDHWKTQILNHLYGLELADYPYPPQNAVHYEPNNSFYFMLKRIK